MTKLRGTFRDYVESFFKIGQTALKRPLMGRCKCPFYNKCLDYFTDLKSPFNKGLKYTLTYCNNVASTKPYIKAITDYTFSEYLTLFGRSCEVNLAFRSLEKFQVSC